MRLSPDSIFPLIVLMTCVELFVFVTARPADILQGKMGLQTLCKDMQRLFKTVPQEENGIKLIDFEQSLTSLPSLDFRTEDLESLEVSSTLAQLYSDLTSFKFHLDWIQQKQDEMGDDFSKTKKITHLIQGISSVVLKQIGNPPSELIHPSLPPLKTSWSLYQANVEIYQKLYSFCNWYVRALRVLIHNSDHTT